MALFLSSSVVPFLSSLCDSEKRKKKVFPYVQIKRELTSQKLKWLLKEGMLEAISI
ncbi:hypothetical protein C2845_PM18G04680 [Panicum miliaceum]|uniref:Uncharacterized protein n=1 Tax=Panicum miliaceum TaxID=4540 RepID=A0A3L6PIH0_PANMI|nr:hypothetical protein C2845_PM18G04680 [Panicum miliaceum]